MSQPQQPHNYYPTMTDLCDKMINHRKNTVVSDDGTSHHVALLFVKKGSYFKTFGIWGELS